MGATIEQFVKVRSSLTRGVIAYLRALAEWPEQEAPPHLRGRKLSELYVEPDVLKQERRDEKNIHRLGVDSLVEEQVARLVHEEKDKRTRVQWNRELRRIHRAAIIGLPGAGKTLLTHMTAHKLAQQSLQDIESQRRGISDVAIPISVRLADIAEKDLATAVQDRIQFVLVGIGFVGQQKAAFDRVVAYILERLGSPQVWLFLDALDEVPEPGRLRLKLHTMANARCRIIVTSRLYGYDTGYLPFRLDSEYELAPFTPRQRRGFIDNWFKNDESKKSHVCELTQANPQFGDLTRNPLLLTLTCATAENHELLPQQTRRVDLYRYIVRDMARGAWKEDANVNDQQVSLLVRLLQGVAWELFHSDPRRTAFDDNEWINTLLKTGKDFPLSWHLDKLFLQLKLGGFVVSPAPGQSIFVHRSFLEFFAAEHVAQQDDPVALIKPFLWQKDKDGILRWQPAAAEMICFVAWCMKEPNPLLQHLLELDKNRRDQYRTMLLLAGRSLRDINRTLRDGFLEHYVASEIISLFRRQVEQGMSEIYNHEWLVLHLAFPDGVKAMAETLLKNMRTGLNNLQIGKLCPDNSDFGGTNHPILQALGQIGGKRVVKALTEVMRNYPDGRVQVYAAEALGTISSEKAVEALIDAAPVLEFDWDRFAMLALGRSDSERAVEALADWLRSSDRDRVYAAQALGQIGSDRAVEALIDCMRNDKHPGPFVTALGETRSNQAVGPLIRQLQNREKRCAAAKALGKIGNEQAVDVLINCLQDDNEFVRRDAALALGQIGVEPAVSVLIERMRNDESSYAREFAAHGLGYISDKSAVHALIRAVQMDKAERVRSAAARALVEIGGEQVEAFIKDLLSDESEEVRSFTVGSLYKIGGGQALEATIGCLRHDESWRVRLYAVSCLSRIGGEAAVNALTDTMQADENGRIREQAVIGLGRIGGEQTVKALLEQVQSQEASLWAWRAVAALGLISRRTGRWIPPIYNP